MLRHRLARLVVLLSVLALVGCDGSIVEHEMRPRLSVAPFDGATGLVMLDVDLTLAPATLVGAELETISAQSTLLTWPDLTPIETSKSSLPATASGDEGARLAPVGAALPGWYVAVVGGTSGVDVSAGTFHRLADGRDGVRVHVGSAPTLWGVGECPKGGETTAIVLEFSEPVQRQMPNVLPIVVALGAKGTANACTLLGVPAEGATFDELEYSCSAPANAAATLTVTIAGGLVSVSGVGVPATQLTAASGTFTLAVVGGCPSVKLDP
jgi:hypothetical protein